MSDEIEEKIALETTDPISEGGLNYPETTEVKFETFEDVVDKSDSEIAGAKKFLGEQQEIDKKILEANNPNSSEAGEFSAGEKVIGEKIKKVGDKYVVEIKALQEDGLGDVDENSFSTSRDVKSEEDQKEESKDQKEAISHCLECGAEIRVGIKFCMSCGKRLTFEEKVFKTNKEKLSAEFEDLHFKSCEKTTESYKRYHPVAFEHLESIAVDNKFKRVLIDNLAKNVCVVPAITEDAVFYSPKHFDNHEKLLDVDRDFTTRGANILMKHEFSHFSKGNKRNNVISQDFINDINLSKGVREEFNKFAQKRGISPQMAINDFFNENRKFIEMQTDVDSFSKNFENKEKFIEDYASERVYTAFLYHGKDSLVSEYKFEIESRFIKNDILKEIAKRQKKIRKDLFKKYNEKYNTPDKDK